MRDARGDEPRCGPCRPIPRRRRSVQAVRQKWGNAGRAARRISSSSARTLRQRSGTPIGPLRARADRGRIPSAGDRPGRAALRPPTPRALRRPRSGEPCACVESEPTRARSSHGSALPSAFFGRNRRTRSGPSSRRRRPDADAEPTGGLAAHRARFAPRGSLSPGRGGTPPARIALRAHGSRRPRERSRDRAPRCRWARRAQRSCDPSGPGSQGCGRIPRFRNRRRSRPEPTGSGASLGTWRCRSGSIRGAGVPGSARRSHGGAGSRLGAERSRRRRHLPPQDVSRRARAVAKKKELGRPRAVPLSRARPRPRPRRDRRGRQAARPGAGGRCRRADRPGR